MDITENEKGRTARPGFWEATRFWIKLGFISFGGPAGQIAIMHQELVDRKKWVSNERFLNALNYCMLLPGPEAQQLATYIGWLLHRLPGGIVAGAFFVIPSVFILFALSYIYAAYGAIPWVAAIFNGLKAAIMAIVVSAVIKIGQKALKNAVMVGIAATSFIAIFFLKTPFPLIVLGAGCARSPRRPLSCRTASMSSRKNKAVIPRRASSKFAKIRLCATFSLLQRAIGRCSPPSCCCGPCR